MFRTLLNRLRKSNERLPPVTFHTNQFGHHYAKVPIIAASLTGDPCPLLRTILTKDLGCEEIFEVSGEGDTWWDFTYNDTRFTCMLLVAAGHGSEFYPTSCTQATAAEKESLKILVQAITHYAQKRRG